MAMAALLVDTGCAAERSGTLQDSGSAESSAARPDREAEPGGSATGASAAETPSNPDPPVAASTIVPPSAGAPALALTVEVDGHPLRVWHKSSASPKRGAILLVHGRTWSAIPDWDLRVPALTKRAHAPSPWSLMDQLALSDFSVYAVDLRGYGQTPRDASGWLTPQRAANDVSATLEWICDASPKGRGDPACAATQKPVVLGWSMGALTSQMAIQQHPDAARAVILFGYPATLDKTWAEETNHDAAPAAANSRKSAASDFRVKQVVQEVIDAYVDACLASDPVRADWTSMHEFNVLRPEALALPVLMLWGEHDPYVRAKDMETFVRRNGMPTSRTFKISNADHAAHLELAAPDFLAAVVTFVDAVDAASGSAQGR